MLVWSVSGSSVQGVAFRCRSVTDSWFCVWGIFGFGLRGFKGMQELIIQCYWVQINRMGTSWSCRAACCGIALNVLFFCREMRCHGTRVTRKLHHNSHRWARTTSFDEGLAPSDARAQRGSSKDGVACSSCCARQWSSHLLVHASLTTSLNSSRSSRTFGSASKCTKEVASLDSHQCTRLAVWARCGQVDAMGQDPYIFCTSNYTARLQILHKSFH